MVVCILKLSLVEYLYYVRVIVEMVLGRNKDVMFKSENLIWIWLMSVRVLRLWEISLNKCS